MNTKTIILKVEIEVPKNYNIDDAQLILSEAVNWHNHEVNITSVTKF